VRETATADAQAWLRRRAGDDLLISDWVVTEVSSALSLKLRTGAVDLPQRAAALAAFSQMSVETFTVLPVLASHFQAAAHFADRHDVGLRGADALHLAVCAAHGATLATLDRRLRDAALGLGVVVETI
jgi:predicted nucleic acid-binding protein